MTTETKPEQVREEWWKLAEKQRSPRLNHLRHAIWHKGHWSGEYMKGIMLSTQRTYWYTRVFKETDGEPWAIRRAKALDAYLSNYDIFIIDQSQIVGFNCERPHQVMLQPEASYLLSDDLFYDQAGYIEPKDREWMRGGA